MTKQNAAAAGIGLDVFAHVAVDLEAYVGNAQMTIGELMALASGSVVTLGHLLGEDVELRLDGATVAKGELVSVDERFGVRITAIVKP
jgi:flagellar motor switch protein FliN/FliY